jgi:hypothetical protein
MFRRELTIHQKLIAVFQNWNSNQAKNKLYNLNLPYKDYYHRNGNQFRTKPHIESPA